MRGRERLGCGKMSKMDHSQGGDWWRKIKLHISGAIAGEGPEASLTSPELCFNASEPQASRAAMTIFKLKQLASTSVHAAGAMFWK